MLEFTAKQIGSILGLPVKGQIDLPVIVRRIAYDSREIPLATETMFVALSGERRDGHDYIQLAYNAGCRVFLVKNEPSSGWLENAAFIVSNNVLSALHQLAVYYRHRFNIDVIGITGSNGKTIVKEWLYQLLHTDFQIARSPKSYNSQLGVPLAIFTLKKEDTLGIFEAGISGKGEMDLLQKIIDPTVGILTYLGSAHAEGFTSMEEKLHEKLLLFKDVTSILFEDTSLNGEIIRRTYPEKQLFSWSMEDRGNLQFHIVKYLPNATKVRVRYLQQIFDLNIPFTDDAYLHNAFTCICYLVWAGYDMNEIQNRLKGVVPVPMRLEIKKGIFNSILINDTYNSDINSLTIAFSAAQKEAAGRKMIFIVSEFFGQSQQTTDIYDQLARLINDSQPDVFIGVGSNIRVIADKLMRQIDSSFFNSTDSLIRNFDITRVKDGIVLLKGARHHTFEKIEERLVQRAHDAVMEINLTAVRHNLEVYLSKINAGTKMMVMVKAGAYGSGSVEVARILQHNKVDYLAVAYIDEGIELRRAGITLPIMVMNSGMDYFERMVTFDLEPELYAISQLDTFIQFAKDSNDKLKAHLKLDTGMHRLGFTAAELPEVIEKLKSIPNIQIVSIFSHLAGSGEVLLDDYTRQQAEAFETMSAMVIERLRIQPLQHILNSSGISRFGQWQYDMVRLGIGLYGIDPGGDVQGLQTVFTLKARISRVKMIPAGSTVGYGRKWTAQRPSRIATISVGYADGLRRHAGNGKWFVLIHGTMAPIVGTICMDMTMIDITDINSAQEGDMATVFGEVNTVMQLATVYDTIPYEVFTGIASRVKRTYIMD